MDYENLTKDQLPKEFRDRIERFNRLFKNGTDHSFEEDPLYAYEMGCVRQALSFAEYFEPMGIEEFKSFCASHDSLYDLVEHIKSRLPYYDEGHSGNSMGQSWMLFRAYKEKPELVQYLHGCLAQLVGDEGYHDDRSDIPQFDE